MVNLRAEKSPRKDFSSRGLRNNSSISLLLIIPAIAIMTAAARAAAAVPASAVPAVTIRQLAEVLAGLSCCRLRRSGEGRNGSEHGSDS